MRNMLPANAFFSLCVVASFFFGDEGNREKILLLGPPVLLIVWTDWFWVPRLERAKTWISKLFKRL
jgi:hypothetical protein